MLSAVVIYISSLKSYSGRCGFYACMSGKQMLIASIYRWVDMCIQVLLRRLETTLLHWTSQVRLYTHSKGKGIDIHVTCMFKAAIMPEAANVQPKAGGVHGSVPRKGKMQIARICSRQCGPNWLFCKSEPVPDPVPDLDRVGPCRTGTL